MFRDLFLSFVTVHILHHVAREPARGLALIQELRRHGYEVTVGTLYPMLPCMEAAGYLPYEARIVGGEVRKYYTITPDGCLALEPAQRQIRELVAEVLDGEGPARLPDGDLSEELAPETGA